VAENKPFTEKLILSLFVIIYTCRD